MRGEKQSRLGELCQQALAETRREELLVLLEEINDILAQQILEVEKVIRRHRKLERLQ